MIVVISLVGLLGMAALAIDLGIMHVARSEAQRAADAGAHAGAGVFILAPQDGAAAEAQAQAFAEMNRIRGAGVAIVPDEDIEVLLDEQKVRVWVRHSAARGNPVATIFARILGIETVDIGAMAAAEVWTAARSECVLPIALPDRWCEEGDGTNCAQYPDWTDDWDPENDGDYYVPWVQNPGASPEAWTYNQHRTGYSDADRGTQITLRPGPVGGGQGQGGGGGAEPNRWNPSWWNAFRIPGSSGTSDFQAHVKGCVDGNPVVGVGSVVQAEPGNFSVPVKSAFDDLIKEDATAVWNTTANDGKGCVTTSGSMTCRSSPRMRPMVLYDPRNGPNNGAQYFELSNLVAVFVESTSGGGPNVQVNARFVEYVGGVPAAGGAGSGSLFKTLRIVE